MLLKRQDYKTKGFFVGEADFQIVDYAGDKCIQFKNDSVFNAMLWEMNDMSEEEK